jgi:MFS family permease
MKTQTITEKTGERITTSLFITQSLFSAATIVAFTLTPIIAAGLSGSEQQAGIPVTFNLVGRALIAYPIGWMMDRFGRRNGLSVGYLLGTMGTAVSVFAIMAGSFPLFVLGAMLVGAARGSAEQSRYVAAEVVPPNRQAKTMGLIVFAGTIGAIGGPLLVAPSGQFATFLGLPSYTGVFLTATIMLALALLITFLFLRPDPLTISRALAGEQDPKGFPKPLGSEFAPTRPMRQIFHQRHMKLALAALAIGQMVMTMLMVITPLHMSHHDHNEQSISFVIMAHTVGMFGLSGVTGWLIDRFGQATIILVGAAILALSSVMTPWSPQFFPLALALFLLGLGWNFCFLAGSALVSRGLEAHERGRVQGTNEMFVALAAGLGSFGTGYLFAWGDIWAVSMVGLFFSLLLVGMTLLWQRPLPVTPALKTGD